MNNEGENLRPLSLDDDILKPIATPRSTELPEDFVRIDTKSEGDKVMNKDSNFICFFGSASSGKSVILSSLLYYFKARAGVLRPMLDSPNSTDANRLLSSFFDDISRGILPARTTRDKVTRLDFVFEPNNNSKKVIPIKLSFLETAGDNNYEIKHAGEFHKSLAEYIKADIPLTFIIVTSYETAHQEDGFISQFFTELERVRKGRRHVENVLLVVSKWDKSGRKIATPEEVDRFVSERLPMTNSLINTYQLTKTFYTIGTVVKKANDEERISELTLDRAEVVAKWLYESIVGKPLDYEGTFWERLKSGF